MRSQDTPADFRQITADLERKLADSLAQQAATSEILRVISQSPTDVVPVFDAIVLAAVRLFRCDLAFFLRCHGATFSQAALVGPDGMPIPLDPTVLPIDPEINFPSRTFVSRQNLHLPDWSAIDLPEHERGIHETYGINASLFLPLLLRTGECVGLLALASKQPRVFDEGEIALAESFRDQAVIAVENTRLFNETQEALQRQTATADVLKVISRSAFDLNSVFDTLARSAADLCEVNLCGLHIREGDFLLCRGYAGGSEEQQEFVRQARIPVSDTNYAMTRALLSGDIVNIANFDSATATTKTFQKVLGFKALLMVPMMREGQSIGLFVLGRDRVGEFSQRHIELVQTFADQAVIAIENVRLFSEVQEKSRDLEEALRYQAGSSNILSVIASSPTDVEPVLKAIVESACELCEAHDAVVLLKDGDDLCFSAHHGPIPINTDRWPIGRGWASGRAVVDRTTVHVHDIYAEDDFSDGRELSRRAGSTAVRSILAAPLLREGESIGSILLRRQEVRPFNDKQISMLQTFADQAVIAIENARLFNETKEALERQTATADVLKIIAGSPTDVQPVFEAIVLTAVRLFGCETAFVQRCDANSFWSVARCRKEGLVTVINPRPGPIDPAENFPSRAIVAKKTLYLPDWSKIELPEFEQRIQRELGYNCAVYFPLLYEGECLGVLGIAGSRPHMFAEADIALGEAFRDQAVIAIRNTQLFDEVQQRTRELSESLDNLRTTQDRLVQTEKLASLGQLTAGIAHEMKNPLNFVNNFAALSTELLDEMTELFENPSIDEAQRRSELNEINKLLRGNLEKVVQHGKRADSIVKNMLLHSREGSGERQSTDINGLVGESLNLAYHGARAERPDFSIRVEEDLDPHAGSAELYPQEITRALLNVISNGFYAAIKRKTENGEDRFEPRLSATTRNLGASVEIRIRDNGTGIPSEVKAKIFDPFFTTKPTGEGTGLGLSMTHDIIVKQHGGRIDVETEPGDFSEFIITLPRGNLKARGLETE